jgi:hypothetical protein
MTPPSPPVTRHLGMLCLGTVVRGREVFTRADILFFVAVMVMTTTNKK